MRKWGYCSLILLRERLLAFNRSTGNIGALLGRNISKCLLNSRCMVEQGNSRTVVLLKLIVNVDAGFLRRCALLYC